MDLEIHSDNWNAIHRNEITHEIEPEEKVNEIIARDKNPISKLAQRVHHKQRLMKNII